MENQQGVPNASTNTIETLRDHLFNQINILSGSPTEQDFQRARGVVSVAQAIINSAKVEVDMVHALKSKQLTGFMANAPEKTVLINQPKSNGALPERSLLKKKKKLSDAKPGENFTHRL